MAHSLSPSRETAFTLLELLASMAVLIFLVLFVVQLMTNVSSVTNTSRDRLDSDDHARMMMDRLGLDIAQMVQRGDVDYFFEKPTSGNDRMFFYAETAGYSTSGTSNRSDLSLIGYRVNANTGSDRYNKLERYAGARQWDGDGTAGMAFLTYTGSTGSCAPLSSTVLSANSVISSTSTDTSYHVLGANIFRIEFCYQLTDGTYSTEPILYTPPSTWSNGTFYYATTNPPSSSNGAPTYSVGSRWYDTNANRGYICQSTTSDTSSLAVWRSIGWEDVSAVVVTIATLDTTNRTRISSMGKDLGNAVLALPKVQKTDLQGTAPTLPAQQWLKKIEDGELATVMPQKAASAVRVYQRYFYLHSQ
ncbi:MAG: type II secretion system protein J [Chthoniobacteraceae bacterium]